MEKPGLTIVAAAIWLAGTPATFAQAVSEEDIVRALSMRPATTDEVTGSRSVDALLGIERGISTVATGDLAAPSIDIRVNFNFDSIELTNETLLSLNALGNALTRKELAEDQIEIVGHTDARGGSEYNYDLSRRRAAAVIDYLVRNFGIDTSRITSSGAGKSALLLPEDPENMLNRRVEVRNISIFSTE